MRLQAKLTKARCETLPHPSADPQVVLEPLDIHAVVFFHEFRELTLLKPQLEFYLQFSEVRGQINKNHYLYLLDVLDERLAWYARIACAQVVSSVG
jgi:hypothetical protein